jgi:histidine triad (HIT) family protein
MNDCIFCRIIEKTYPAEILYKDDDAIVIYDHKPIAPVHLLIIPRVHIASLNDLSNQDEVLAGRLLLIAKKVAQQIGLGEKGYRLVINTGVQGGQTVFHLHIHLLGGELLDFTRALKGLN